MSDRREIGSGPPARGMLPPLVLAAALTALGPSGAYVTARSGMAWCAVEGHRGGPLQTGIFGTVSDGAQPAAAVELSLVKVDGGISEVAATTTDADGDYDFTGIPSLQPDELYYVQYGPNSSDSSRVFYWFGPDILEYVAGTATPGGTFDIADISLSSPADGAMLPLPVQFTWALRSNPEDSYRWFLIDQATGDQWFSLGLGYVAEYTLGELPSGAQYGRRYRWHMAAFTPEDGYGLSFGIRDITFTGGPPSTTQTATVSPTASPTPSSSPTLASATPTPSSTLPPASSTPSVEPSATGSSPSTPSSPTPGASPTTPGTTATLTPTGTLAASPSPSVTSTAQDSSPTASSAVTPATGTPTPVVSPTAQTASPPATSGTATTPLTATATATATAAGSATVLRFRIALPWLVRYSAGSVMNRASSPTRK